MPVEPSVLNVKAVVVIMIMMVTVARFSAATLAICGSNTACSNSHGSYSCPCNTGYEGWVAGQVGALVQCSTCQVKCVTRCAGLLRH